MIDRFGQSVNYSTKYIYCWPDWYYLSSKHTHKKIELSNRLCRNQGSGREKEGQVRERNGQRWKEKWMTWSFSSKQQAPRRVMRYEQVYYCFFLLVFPSRISLFPLVFHVRRRRVTKGRSCVSFHYRPQHLPRGVHFSASACKVPRMTPTNGQTGWFNGFWWRRRGRGKES